MSICATLRSFARQREKAYSITRSMTGRRASAIGKIIRVTEYLQGKKEEWRAVDQLRNELLTILPPEQSRFTKIRTKILHLIQQHHEH